MSIKPGEWLRCLEARESNRGVKVLGVYHPISTPGLIKAQAVVYSQGKITVFSLDRLEDRSRFEPVVMELV